MIDALPIDYQDAARALKKSALRIAELGGDVLGAAVGFVVPAELADKALDWIARLDGMCRVVK